MLPQYSACTIKGRQAEIENLHAEIQLLKKTNQEQIATHQEIATTLVETQEQLTAVQRTLEEKQAEVTLLQTQVADIQAQNARLLKQDATAQAIVEENTRLKDTLEGQKILTQLANNICSQLIDKVKQLEADLAYFRKKNDTLKSELKTQNEQFAAVCRVD